MKNKIKSLLLISSICAISAICGSQASAQTNATPTTPIDFFNNVGNYFTDINTNLTWSNTPFSLWTGANYQSGVNTSAEIGFSYDAFKPAASSSSATSLAIAPEALARNAGIAGTLVDAMAGVGLSVEHYSLKFTGYADGGYSFAMHHPEFEIGARVLKKMTISTHAGIGLGAKHIFRSQNANTPNVTAFLGWDF